MSIIDEMMIEAHDYELKYGLHNFGGAVALKCILTHSTKDGSLFSVIACF